MEADKTQVSALLDCQSRAEQRRIRGLEPPSFITLACKHNRADLLQLLLKDDPSSPSGESAVVAPRWCSMEQQDEGHPAVYYAIRSSNVELLRTLLGTVTPELLERLVSESYEELLLNNVPVSEEMHWFLQYKLLDQRFFSKGDGALPDTSTANIQERIQMLMENIAQINSYKEVDSHFLYTAKFIAQNIHILKQQLKSTYNILPWEEIEFCLVSFVSAYIRQQELNIFYLSVLRKERLLDELNKFASALQELEEHIGATDVQTLRKPVELSRDDVAATISIKYPELYSDHKEVRDIYSLHIMKTYLEAALLADSATRRGQLTIKRALQVTGEHLKNTLDNPYLSPAVSELLLLSAPKETKKILQDLSVSLSHPHLESEDSIPYSDIQIDIVKISSVISHMTYFNKVDKIKSMLTKLINSESEEEFMKIANVFQNINDIKAFQETDTVTTYHRTIEDLIRNIEDQTSYEKKLFAGIKIALEKTQFQLRLTSDDYFILKEICHRSSNVQSQSTKNIANIIRDMKHLSKCALEHFSSQRNLEVFESCILKLGGLLSEFYKSVSMRIKPETANKIKLVISRLINTVSIDKGNINCIDDYSRQLSFSNKINEFEKVKDAKHSSEMIIEKQLILKLTELENAIGVERMRCHLYELVLLLHKDKTTNRFVVEALVLDIMTLLDSSNRVPNNVLYLDGDMPLLNGKSLRNYLAHGHAIADILPTDPWSAVLLNVLKLTESKDDLLNCKFGNILKHDIKQLRRRYERGLSILDKQKEMWKSLLDGNFENLASEIAEGADICSRKEDFSSTLHYAARGPNIEIIKFLTKQEMISTEERDVNGQTVLHVAAAFGRDVTVEFLVVEMGNAINQVDNAGKTPMHLASQNGHNKTVMTLLSLGAKTTIKDITGIPPLHYAVKKNYLDIVKMLSEKDATVDENTDCEGCTSLHVAAEYGHVEIVHYLLLNGADVNAKGNQGNFPLHLAAGNGHLEVVKALLEKGAHVNFRDRTDQSPLYVAVTSSNEEIVKILLEKGASVNYGETCDTSPFHSAVLRGNAIIVDLLLEHNANVNTKINGGYTPLLFAAGAGHAKIVDLLLQRGALADSKDDAGQTALHIAAESGHSAVVEMLIQRKFDIDTKNSNKLTPLHLAARAGHLQVVDILLAAGADVHSANEGVTALHLSAANGHEAISEALIKKGAKVNCKDNDKITPLHAAATKTCNEKTIKMLLKYGANVNEREGLYRTSLHIASLAGDNLMVEALLQAKADVEATDMDGDTALHMAASGNHKAAVEVLLKHGADVDHMDATGSTALCWAAKNNNTDLLDTLIKEGATVNIGGGQLLLTAIKAGRRHVVEALLKNKDVDINIKDHNGLNLLYVAAENGDELIARALIKRGIHVADCIRNPSPLLIAIYFGHTKFVNVLLENKADANPADPNLLPLHYAVRLNKPDIVERLLHWGANPNIKDSLNVTPLELAVTLCQIETISILLQQEGVRINERGNADQTLLHIAAEAGNLEVTRLLVDRGADINAEDKLGSKPLHVAARQGHCNILDLFLASGMTLDDPNNDCNLMHYAAVGGNLEVAQYLMDKQVDINSSDSFGYTPIHHSAELGHTEMVKLLLNSGAVYDARDKFGRTPSDLTKSQDIKELLESIGKLFNAVKKNHVSLIGSLVKKLGNYANIRSSDNATLLHIASQGGFQEMCELLLKSKADPNAVGKDGEAPLHYASKYSYPGIVKVLLKNGAVHNLKSDKKKTPLDFAIKKEVKSLLQTVASCFSKVQTGDVTVIEDISKIRDVEIIKVVTKARDTEGNTLLLVAMKNGFPGVDELKQVLQVNQCP